MARSRLTQLRRFSNKTSKQAKTPIGVGSLSSFFSFNKSTAGPTITPDNALELTTVLTCVRVLAESVASLPLDLFIKTEDGKSVKRDTDNPLYWLLKLQPNDETTSYELRLWMMVDALLRGNGYAQIIRSTTGVLEIWPLLASKVKPKRRDNGKLVYVYPIDKNKEVVLDANEVLHIKTFINGGLVGLSLVDLQKELLGSAKAAEEYSAEFFANASSPSGVLEVPEELSDEAYERLKNNWTDIYTGSNNRHKSPVLEGGTKFNPILLNHEETQLLETRKFQRSAISGLFRVPSHLINDLEKATFSNIEHQDLGFIKHSLRPWLTNWEQRCSLTLLEPHEKRTHYFRHNLNDLLRGDMKSRAESYGSFIQNGILSPNEVRKKEEENPYEGGDAHLINGTLRPIEEAGNESRITNFRTKQSEDEACKSSLLK